MIFDSFSHTVTLFLRTITKRFTILLIFIFTAHTFSQTKSNIVWIVCEDISPYIGVYGDATVRTPNIDALARDGVRYTRVYTTAGVCAPSRSSIITGMNQISIGTSHMRTTHNNSKLMPEGVPSYSAVLPPKVKAFPEYLRKVGYYTSNNAKEDYQFEEPVTVWDESSIGASYQNRKAGQPFFSVFNFAISHESQIISPPDSLYYDPSKMVLPLYYQNTEQMRHDKAALYTRIEQMDSDVGELIQQLKKDGVYDDSYVIFYSDHGGNLPWMKREILERGTHIPFVVKHPGSEMAGTVNNDLISSVDFAPSMLSIARADIPDYLQGKPFLGPKSGSEKNQYVFAGRDRMADKYDRVRSVTDGTFRYVYNFHPELPKYQDLAYRRQMVSMQEIIDMRDAGKITNPYLSDWFNTPKPQEEFYYTTKDPDEVHNLADDPAYQDKKNELKEVLFNWLEVVGDTGKIPEKEMVRNMWWKGKDDAPMTEKPVIKKSKEGVTLSCATDGASIGYRIFKDNVADSTLVRDIKTWDFFYLMPHNNKKTVTVPKPWNVYTGGNISLKKGQTIQVNAHRIGYKPTEIIYKFK
ncbi:MAG: sulfatase [Bacteroidota bacterium]|uniref:Sulfatase n=3 Tax=Flagellimonas TaxID=444459 RepID=A0A3A1NS65_9FLAO|nr:MULTISPECIES: sulfatase [Allomuricauda]MAO15469.1 sulfatase [Allomuricauda sp.]MEC8832040.1 sulfatase [Bacteroidota bacterium]MBW8244982.1 sulfatase [Allomuricauda oceani]NDV43517.1 sulfatase-like hydrolase/transferase [Allomuricauda sediminis]QII43317.1 sulfatase [Allomuricauda oceani]|tara:strand:+ start:2428 stop:4167 length:1740 start_codon:yes stop_codon:yes gene_type:complete